MKKQVLLLCSLLGFLFGYSQTVLINSATQGGFESGTTFAANGWTVVNGGTNQWYVGATGVPFAGTRCAYISNTGGTSYNYDVNAASVVHFYRDIAFPAGETNIQLSFRWKGQGESGFDYIRVYLVPTTTVPIAGTQLTSGQIGGNFNLQGTYQLANLTLPCSAAGTTMRLVFSWRNDNSVGTQPPGAIDNIHLTSALPGPCALGTGVTTVPALPYASGAGTTCGAGNDQTPSNVVVCGSSNYYNGEDRVWVFTPTTSGNVTITLTSSGTYTGLMLYQGCPNCGTCVASAQSSTGNKTLCATVIAGQTYYLILDSWPSPTCNPYSNLTISAPVPGFASCNMGLGGYTVSSIPYAPETWTTGTTVPGLTVDDIFSSAYVPINFPFCYDGQTGINQGLISANGYIIFDTPDPCHTNLPSNTNAAPSAPSGWTITSNIPNTDNAPRNAILGYWADINPNVGGAIRTNPTGVAPNRVFTVKWDNVPMYDCTTLLARTQIRLFEQNNVIEVHIGNKPSCPWNNDRAICGLHNYNGTQAVVPAAPNRNAIPSWPTASNEAWRFTPTGCSVCLTLPLQITDLKGELQNDKVYLQWTAGEMNVQTFYVERSTDGTVYFPVNDQNYKGAGTYISMDAQPIPGKTFYRVYAKTKDGGYIYGNPIEIDYAPKYTNATILALYPNPAQDEIKLDMYFPVQTNGELEILDMYGKLIKKINIGSATGRFSIPVNVAEISNGFYMVRFYDGKQYSETYKFMKQ